MPATVDFAFRDPNTVGIATDNYQTLVGALRFCTADNNTGTPTDNPLIRPVSGTNRSFTKNVRIRVSQPPNASLLNLRIKSSVVEPVIGAGPDSGLALAYSFIQLSEVGSTPNVQTPIYRTNGYLGTSDITWTTGRALASGNGTPVGSHTGPLTPNQMWGGNGAGSSDMLFLQMEVEGGGSYTTGGTVSSFNLIASYNEI